MRKHGDGWIAFGVLLGRLIRLVRLCKRGRAQQGEEQQKGKRFDRPAKIQEGTLDEGAKTAPSNRVDLQMNMKIMFVNCKPRIARPVLRFLKGIILLFFAT